MVLAASIVEGGDHRRRRRTGESPLRTLALALAPVALCGTAAAQGFPNIPRTPGELLSGPIAPEQGRTAIVAWHGERIVTVPEGAGSQPGADVLMRIVDINDPVHPQVTTLASGAAGFLAHGYFQYGPYLYVGTHCMNSAYGRCSGPDSIWMDSFRISAPGTGMGGSGIDRARMEQDAGIPVGSLNRSGAQSPWGAEAWRLYNHTEGLAYPSERTAAPAARRRWPRTCRGCRSAGTGNPSVVFTLRYGGCGTTRRGHAAGRNGSDNQLGARRMEPA